MHTEVPLVAAASTASPRQINGAHFHTTAPLPDGSHVLLVDDTWTSGGHAQSAVLALRTAGARYVSVLVVARWIDKGFGANARFVVERLTRDYGPLICPWTGNACP